MAVVAARAEQATSALRTLPTTCLVAAHAEGEAGVTLRAAEAAASGGVLLEVPLSCCVTSRDLDGHPLSERLPPDDSFGRLLAALLLLVQRFEERGGEEEEEADPRAEYYTKVVPPDFFVGSMMACWEGEELKKRLENSCSWKLGRAFRQEVEDEHRALAQEGLEVSFERCLWAKLVVQTRAVNTGGAPGHILPPVLDLANHRSLGASSRVKLVEGAVQIVALEDVDAREEVTFCYDPDADYLDLFERYGFFDEQNPVRTVQVTVPPGALLGADAEEWRRELLEAQAGRGCNQALNAWWVPEIAIEACPLFAAVRAGLVSQQELSEQRAGTDGRGEGTGCPPDARLRTPIRAEAEVRERVAGLLADHLAGYSTTLLQDAADLEHIRRREHEWPEEAALQLLVFEKSLLCRQVEALRGGVAPAGM